MSTIHTPHTTIIAMISKNIANHFYVLFIKPPVELCSNRGLLWYSLNINIIFPAWLGTMFSQNFLIFIFLYQQTYMSEWSDNQFCTDLFGKLKYIFASLQFSTWGLLYLRIHFMGKLRGNYLSLLKLVFMYHQFFSDIGQVIVMAKKLFGHYIER